MSVRLLIVDDDPNIREVIGFAVDAAGFEARFASDGLAALEAAQRHSFDLIVLDIGLPELDGLAVCRDIRKRSDVPILFLTARDEEIDRVIGLEIGGDDYVTKPFSPRELVARIKVILKRTRPTAPPEAEPQIITWQDITIDPARHACRVDGQEVALTASELQLLRCLMGRPDSVLSRRQVMDAMYGHAVHVSERTVDSHVRNVRNKLAKAGCAQTIVTVHGVGLRMGHV